MNKSQETLFILGVIAQSLLEYVLIPATIALLAYASLYSQNQLASIILGAIVARLAIEFITRTVAGVWFSEKNQRSR